MCYISCITSKEAQRGARIHKWIEMRRVERFWALFCPEALGIGSSVALKDKEANALQNLARLTSLIRARI